MFQDSHHPPGEAEVPPAPRSGRHGGRGEVPAGLPPRDGTAAAGEDGTRGGTQADTRRHQHRKIAPTMHE